MAEQLAFNQWALGSIPSGRTLINLVFKKKNKTKKFRKTCRQLRRQGLALTEIVEKTGRPKTSVYYHIKDVPKNKTLKHKIYKSKIESIVPYNKSRKGKSAKDRHPKKFSKWTPKLVQLTAHLTFDGETNKRGCTYSNQNQVLVNKVENLVKQVYKFKPSKTESTPGVKRISYYNVELGLYMKKKSKKLLDSIQSIDKNCQKIFLKAFFDDEGCISVHGSKRTVRGYQHNYKILKLIKSLLKNFNIDSRVDKKYNEIIISRKENLIKFQKEINFSKGVCINPDRKNSI